MVRAGTSVVVGGNGRLQAMHALGWDAAKIVEIELTDAQAAALGVALNRTGELAEWDTEVLQGVLDGLGDADIDLDALALSPADLDALLVDVTHHQRNPPLQVVEDNVPESSKKPVTKLGDVWALGRHTVVCGDSASVDFPVEYDLLATDPPYGVSYADKNSFLNSMDGGSRNQTPIENDSHSYEDMGRWWLPIFTRLQDAARPGACYYMTGPSGGDLSMMMMMMQEAGWLLKHVLIWVKNNHVLGRCDYNYKHEPILYGWKPGAAHYFGGTGSDTSVWEIPRPQKSVDHPTMKPVELFAKCIDRGSQPGELVVDPFLGSGTTLIAAEQLDRICYGVELSPNYCDVIVERWEAFTGGKATRSCI